MVFSSLVFCFVFLPLALAVYWLALLGTPGSNYILQASTNLSFSNWVAIQTNPAPFSFIETNTGSFPQRFYRAVVAP